MDLKTWREKKGKTQVMVSELLGITQSHLSKIEMGKVGPSLALLREIVELTGGAVGLNDFVKKDA